MLETNIPIIYLPSSKKIKSEEGIDHINISVDSNTELGRKLSPSYYYPFFTYFGKMPSINTGINYLLIDGYPTEFLNANTFTDEEKEFLKEHERKTSRTYYSDLAYLVIMRIMCDPDLMQELKSLDPDIIITSYYNTKKFDKESKEAYYKPRYKLGNYLIILRHIINLIQKDEFDMNSIMLMISNIILGINSNKDLASILYNNDYEYKQNK